MTGRPTTPDAADFPASNLPASAQSWGRAVAQRIAQAEAQNARQDARILDLNHSLVGAMRGGADGDIYTPNGIVIPRIDQHYADETLWTIQRLQSIEDGTIQFDSAYNIGSPNDFGLELHAFSNDFNGRQAHHDVQPVEDFVGNVLYLNSDTVKLQEQQDGFTTTQWLETGLDQTGYPFLKLLYDDWDASSQLGYKLQIYRDGAGGGQWKIKLLDAVLGPGWYADLTARSLPSSATAGQFLTWNGSAWVPANPPLPATATSGQVLTWDGTKWAAATLPTAATGGATQLAQLTDVDESTPPTSGQALTWNGTKWAPATPAAPGGSGLPATATTGQFLEWNGTAWVAANLPSSSGGSSLPSSATAGQFLEWNGSAWVAASVPSDLPGTALSGQVLTWNGTAWAAASPAASGGTSGSVLSSYKGDWVPTPATPTGTPTTYFLAPDNAFSFDLSGPPAWVSRTLNGGAISVVPGSDSTLTPNGQFPNWLKLVGGAGALTYLEFVIDSAGNSYTNVIWAFSLAANVQLQVTVDGQNIETDRSTSPLTRSTDLLQLVNSPYFATPGKHTVRIAIDATGASGIGTVWLNVVNVHGTTPTGDTAGMNTVGGSTPAPSYTNYGAGDLVRYGGDLWLAEQATDNEAAPADGGIWAKLSSHSSSGGSGEQHTFASAGQWTMNHSIGRIPSVTVYDAGGNLLLAEAAATATQVVITFANPTAGTAVLT